MHSKTKNHNLLDPKPNGKKHSTTDSIYSLKKPVNEKLEQSWIFALCMRCRVEYKTPSWEPKHWQTICPFPLCPSYRQFARIISIILIGELELV